MGTFPGFVNRLIPDMILSRKILLRIIIPGFLLPALSNCASYNERIEIYYASVSEGDYVKANTELDKIALLKRGRNKLLYLLEKGRVSHALALYDTSNYFFNQADEFMEKTYRNPGDILAGTLVNPMMQTYRGEDFEKLMVHYYKALNYLYIGQPDEAVVEARRISLQIQQQGDKGGNKDKRYSTDTFSLMLQGMIYESANDVNNAFIAYRNAAETYLKGDNQVYYGVKIPEQLKRDLLRTAYLNGFTDELTRFESIFNMEYSPSQKPEGGELIILWENGMAPVKQQQDFFFMLNRRAGGFYFIDQHHGISIPFNYDHHLTEDQFDALHLHVFHVAFPRYESRFQAYSSALISNGTDSLFAEKAEDINELATQALKQRFVKDMSLALSRIAVKQAAALLVKGTDKDSKKDRKLRKEISKAIELYSVISEKPDTRNWQSLPALIYYARLPLKIGNNKIAVTLLDQSGREETKSINLEGKGRLVFYNFASQKSSGRLHK